ncbi:MAG TPA: MFS transporter [Oscillatoriales cyanobacterium M59_W2019_021]|nr:MFS transporter [Oscillatoriales cyanobacterium M4454_W2019_049]HIK53409.1 MFS transporter [Oscillatoriales cyanobacterium M59_W2019_021]
MVVIPKIQAEAVSPSRREPQAWAKWGAMLGISMGVFLFALDVYIVNLALPVMVESLHTDFVTIQWVVLSYLLAIAVFVLSAAKLGDIFSKKRLYILGMVVFTVGSLLCALSPTVEWAIAFRFLQGIGAAFLSGLGTAAIVEIFPPEQRGLGLGIRAGVFGLGIMLGPTVGGLLVAWGDWPLIFWINVPIGLVGTLMVARLVPPSAGSGISQRFDWAGTLILSLVLTGFSLGMTRVQSEGFDSVGAIALLVISAMGFVGFLLLELRLPEPMLDLKLFRSVEFSLGLALRFIGNFVMAGAIFILPFFLQWVKHYSADRAGLLLAIPPAIIVLTAPIAGVLADRCGTRIVSLVGLLSIALGCFLMGGFDAQLTLPIYIAGVVPYALGVGLFQSPNNSTIMGAAPPDHLGLASGLLSLSRILGQTAGVPLVGILFSSIAIASAQLTPDLDVTQAPVEALVVGVQIAFQVMAVLSVAAAAIAAIFWGLHKPDRLS